MLFDYRGRGNSSKAPNLPTVESMLQDVTRSLSHIEEKFGKKPDVVIGQAIGCRLALECLKDHPEIPLVMWAPIIWFQTSAEIRYRMHELRRTGVMAFDGAAIGGEFVQSATDPSDHDIQSWICPARVHTIVHGAEDQVVAMRLLIEMRDLIEGADARVELFLAPGPHPHPGADVQAQISKIVEVVGGLL